MRVMHITDWSELHSHADEWNRLAEGAPGGHPMSSAAWLLPLFQHLMAPDRQWHVLLAVDDDELTGVLPLIEHRHPRIPGLVSAATPHDPHAIATSALLRAHGAADTLAALLAEARRVIPSALRIELPMTLEDSPALATPPPAGFLTARTASLKGSYIDTSTPYATYHATLSRNARNNLQKATNKLRRLDGVQYRIDRGPQARADWLETFGQVEGSGWKGEAQTDIASSARVMDFYSSVVSNIARLGWLEWHVLEAEGRVLAANLALRFGRTVYIWKLGYLHDYRQYSPGSLLLRYVAEQTCASETERIDLMTDFPWYSRWRMGNYPYWNLAFYPRDSLRARAAYHAVSLRRRFRRSATPESAAEEQ